MPKITLDLKDYTHVKSNGYTTTIKHKKHGHSITIAHKMLPEDQRAPLEALAKSSKVKPQSEPEVKMAEGGSLEARMPDAPENMDPGPASPNMAPISKREEIEQALKMSPESVQEIVDQTPLGMAGVVKPVASAAEAAVLQGIGPNIKNIVPAAQQAYEKLLAHLQSGKASSDQIKQISDTLFGSVKQMKAEGGEVRPKYAEGDMVIPQALRPEPPTEQAKPSGAFVMPNIQMPAKGNMPEQASTQDPNLKYQDIYNKTLQEQRLNNPGQPEFESERIAVDLASRSKLSDNAKAQATQENQVLMDKHTAELDAKKASLGLTTPGAVATEPSASGLQGPAQMPQGSPSGLGSLMSGDPTEAMMNKGFGNMMQGINQQAQAQDVLAQQQAKLLEAQQNNIRDAQLNYQNQYNSLNKERQAFMQDIQNNHVDPEQYWNGVKDPITGEVKGGHSKIASAIGMILAGFNPTSNPNAAVQFLQKQMDMNLDAQKANLNSRNNLLAANLKQFGNMNDATTMTRIMQSDMMQKELQMAAAKAQSPMAKAAALQAAGKLQMEMAPIFQQFAMRRALMSAANTPGATGQTEQMLQYLRMTNPAMAKEMESRYVPGMGMASIPVPDKVREEIGAKHELQQAAQDLYQWSARHTGSLNPADIAAGKIKAQRLQSLYREGMLKTVYREGEQPLLDKVVNEDPTSFFNHFSTLPKLKEVMAGNNHSLNTLASHYGLNNQSAQQQAPIRFVPKKGK